ncbi:MAG: hypothetical protein ACREJQ_06275 [bacterium]
MNKALALAFTLSVLAVLSSAPPGPAPPPDGPPGMGRKLPGPVPGMPPGCPGMPGMMGMPHPEGSGGMGGPGAMPWRHHRGGGAGMGRMHPGMGGGPGGPGGPGTMHRGMQGMPHPPDMDVMKFQADIEVKEAELRRMMLEETARPEALKSKLAEIAQVQTEIRFRKLMHHREGMKHHMEGMKGMTRDHPAPPMPGGKQQKPEPAPEPALP